MDSLLQVRDDLAFVRRAVERQQRLRRAILPWWFAALIGVSVLLRCIGADHSPGLHRFVRENPPLTLLAPLWLFQLQLVVLLAGLTSLHVGLAGATGLLFLGAGLEMGLLALVFLSNNGTTVFGALFLVGLVLCSLHEERASAQS